MKRTLIFLIFLIGQSLTVQSQEDSVLDSLLIGYESTQLGFDQIEYTLGIASRLMTSKTEEAKSYLNIADSLSQLYNEPSGLSKVKLIRAINAYGLERDMEKCMSLTQQALQLAEASKCNNAIIEAAYNYARYNRIIKGDIEAANKIIKKYEVYLNEDVLQYIKAMYFNEQAILFGELNALEQSKSAWEKSISHFEISRSNPDFHYRLNRIPSNYFEVWSSYMNTKISFSYQLESWGYLEEAEDQLKEIYKLAQAKTNWDYMALASREKGRLNLKQAKFNDAIASMTEAIELWEEHPVYPMDLILAKVYLSDVFFKLEEYDDAQISIENALKELVSAKDTSNYLVVLARKFKILNATEQYELANSELLEALEMAEKFGSDGVTLNIKEKLTENMRLLKRFDKAEQYAKEVIEHHASKSTMANASIALNELAKIYFDQDNLEKANISAQEFLENSQTFEMKTNYSIAYKLLSKISERQGDYKKAFDYFNLYHTHFTDKLEVDAQKAIRKEQVKQNVSQFKKDKELAEKEATLLESQNRIYLILASGLLAVILMGAYFYSKLRKSKLTIEKQKEQLEELNVTKDKFFSIIAHDIRSPIVALEGIGEQMGYHLDNGNEAKLKNLSHNVGKTANRLNTLLDNLLNWALIQRGVLPHNPKTLNLKQLVDETINMFQFSAEQKDIKLIAELDADLSVYVDHDALSTIVRNLISNAIKFTPRGGTIKIISERTQYNVALKIIDSGVGIAQNKLSKIFDLDPSRARGTEGEKGTGLGLMLCKELVELNKGEIKVGSELNKGTTIQINLPKVA